MVAKTAGAQESVGSRIFHRLPTTGSSSIKHARRAAIKLQVAASGGAGSQQV